MLRCRISLARPCRRCPGPPAVEHAAIGVQALGGSARIHKDKALGGSAHTHKDKAGGGRWLFSLTMVSSRCSYSVSRSAKDVSPCAFIHAATCRLGRPSNRLTAALGVLHRVLQGPHRAAADGRRITAAVAIIHRVYSCKAMAHLRVGRPAVCRDFVTCG